MNKRIQKLAEQSGIDLPDSSAYNGHIYQNSIERFARIIVQDCFKQLEDYCSSDAEEQFTYAKSVAKMFRAHSLDDAKQQIFKNLGVDHEL